jgi:hypothetical protein
VELYTPFAASPPNPTTLATSPQTPVPLPYSPPTAASTSISTSSRLTGNGNVPQASPIAFFTVNRPDCVIIYYDATYQHYMIYTCLPTLHFIHSDCYDLFQIQSKNNLEQSNEQRRTTLEGTSVPTSGLLVNNSMISSTLMGVNGFNPSTTPLLGQVTDKEYCQAKKPNNRFNVALGTKFYRVRVKPWKPSISPNN